MLSPRLLWLRVTPCLVAMVTLSLVIMEYVVSYSGRSVAGGGRTGRYLLPHGHEDSQIYHDLHPSAGNNSHNVRRVTSSQRISIKAQTFVFYNRVPKCGSSALMWIMKNMADVHNVTFIKSRTYMKFWLSLLEEDNLVNRLESLRPPFILERHVHFINFQKHTKYLAPIYINVARDPIERLVSWYYYRRYQRGHARKMSLIKRIRTYDECVLGNYSECTEPLGETVEEGYFKIIPFFCGHEEFCGESSDRALSRAKENVRKYYAVVGSTDYLKEFLQVLENVLPDYFMGASALYQQMGASLRERYRTQYKLPVSLEVRQIMKIKLKQEYQFYYFIKNRFQHQYRTIFNVSLTQA